METLWTCQVKDKCKTTMLEKSHSSKIKQNNKTTAKLQKEINN